MSVVRGKEDTIAQNRRSPVGALGGVARDDSRRSTRPGITPYLASGAGIERAYPVRSRNIHDAVAHQRRHLDAGIRNGITPLKLQPAKVRGDDTIEGAVKACAEV